jgi:hypothetical protein
VNEGGVRAWFGQYLTVLAARGRGDSDDLDAFLQYYAVPLVVATDDAAKALGAADEVIGFARRQVEGMRAANYDRSATINSEFTELNATSALYRATFARQRGDGSEIGRFGVTYLITDGAEGLRISALAVHAP